jgi:hypothetical protein
MAMFMPEASPPLVRTAMALREVSARGAIVESVGTRSA